MAKKKAAAKEVERKVLSNGVILIKYDDGSYALLTPISAEDAEDIFGGEAEDSEDEDDEDEDTPQGGCQGAGHHSAQGKGRFQEEHQEK